ncbi:MAG: hypothetical protein ACR2NA_09610 [Solirubrobacterales bacterium]
MSGDDNPHPPDGQPILGGDGEPIDIEAYEREVLQWAERCIRREAGRDSGVWGPNIVLSVEIRGSFPTTELVHTAARGGRDGSRYVVGGLIWGASSKAANGGQYPARNVAQDMHLWASGG